MNEKEKTVAETALSIFPAQHFGVIHEEVAHLTGVPAGDVEKILDHLAKEMIIKRCATPAHNEAVSTKPADLLTWAWYERGDLWPKDGRSVFAQHADAGPWHYETRFVVDHWEWDIYERHGKVASGRSMTLEGAKAAVVIHTGRKPEKPWRPIGGPV